MVSLKLLKRLTSYQAISAILGLMLSTLCYAKYPSDVVQTSIGNYSEQQILQQIVYNPGLAPDTNCNNVEDPLYSQEIYSWQLFAYLNSPIYYAHPLSLIDDNTKVGKIGFWADAPMWYARKNNLAPRWASMYNHQDAAKAKPPFIQPSIDWQCQGDCLSTKIPTLDGSGNAVLLDNNGNKIHFEQRFNQAWLYSTVELERNLDLTSGQLFQRGKCDSTDLYAPSIMMKLGWRILTEKDNAAHYINMYANDKIYGLVAMHVVTKTAANWEWIWASFEHKYNFTPPEGAKTSNFKTSNSKCDYEYKKGCIPKLNPYKISEPIQRINTIVKNGFSQQQSPLQYYQMLGVQYTSAKDITIKQYSDDNPDTHKADIAGCQQAKEDKKLYFIPDNNQYLFSLDKNDCQQKTKIRQIVEHKLYNPVFEPYPSQIDDKSCFECHVNATYNTKRNGKKVKIPADFTFALDQFFNPINHTNK